MADLSPAFDPKFLQPINDPDYDIRHALQRRQDVEALQTRPLAENYMRPGVTLMCDLALRVPFKDSGRGFAGNDRSALDHAWVQTVVTPSKYTKFPIRKTREGLIAAVNGLKENASEEVKRYIVNFVQPNEGGDGKILAGLNDLDIEDKHWLLIAHLQLTHISGLRAVDGDWQKFHH